MEKNSGESGEKVKNEKLQGCGYSNRNIQKEKKGKNKMRVHGTEVNKHTIAANNNWQV